MNNSNKILCGILLISLSIFIIGIGFFCKYYSYEQWQSTQIKSLNENLQELKIQLIESSEKLVSLEEQREISNYKLSKLLSFYQKLSVGVDVSILIVGDSISNQEWPNWLVSYLENTYDVSVNLKNISMSGNSSYAGYVRLMTLDYKEDILTDYDLIIFCYGQNDDIDNFGQYYEGMIRAARLKYPHASIISVLESSQKEYTEKMQIIQELSKHYEILIADTIEPFMNGNFGTYDILTTDGIHPNTAGAQIYADTIGTIIDQEVKTWRSDIAATTPVYKGVEKFDNFVWFGVDQFRKEQNTFILEFNESISGTLALYYSYIPGKNACQIYIDDVKTIECKFDWPYDFSQPHIVEMADTCTVLSSLKISFENETEADGFYGVCFNWE